MSKRITCNALAPRYVNTDMMNTYSANQVEALMALIPMVCFAEPKEPADAAPFLTSNASA